MVGQQLPLVLFRPVGLPAEAVFGVGGHLASIRAVAHAGAAICLWPVAVACVEADPLLVGQQLQLVLFRLVRTPRARPSLFSEELKQNHESESIPQAVLLFMA